VAGGVERWAENACGGDLHQGGFAATGHADDDAGDRVIEHSMRRLGRRAGSGRFTVGGMWLDFGHFCLPYTALERDGQGKKNTKENEKKKD
jgi:hypothetical protein